MKRTALSLSSLLLTGLLFTACNDAADKKTTETAPEIKLKEEAITYTDGGDSLKGFIVYNENDTVKRPAILVVPEWWGLDDYPKYRARELARLGYVAMAVDIYGNGKIAETPDSAGKWASAYYANPAAGKSRIDAALAVVKGLPVTDTAKVAAIGYCFGGGMVLNVARLGANLKSVVSFHGTLDGVQPNKDLLKASVLVCNGAADPFVKPESIALFKKQMDSIGADYTFKDYPGALHAFTNPKATENGKKFNMPIAYDPAADTASWKDMQAFLDRTLK